MVYDLNNSFYTDNTGPDNLTTQILNNSVGGTFLHSEPTIVDGYVYMTNRDGNIYKFNENDLSVEGIFETGGDMFRISPTVVDGYVYTVTADNNTIYKLNADDMSLVDKYVLDYSIYSSPTIVNGYIYIVAEDNNTYQLDATDMSLVNKVYINNTINTLSNVPAYYDGYIYISAGNQVYQLDANDLTILNTYETDDVIRVSPVIYEDNVYVADISGTISKLYHNNLSLSDNITLSTSNFAATPAVNDDSLFITRGTTLYKINVNDMSLDNTFNMNGSSFASPALTNDYIYVADARFTGGTVFYIII